MLWSKSFPKRTHKTILLHVLELIHLLKYSEGLKCFHYVKVVSQNPLFGQILCLRVEFGKSGALLWASV